MLRSTCGFAPALPHVLKIELLQFDEAAADAKARRRAAILKWRFHGGPLNGGGISVLLKFHFRLSIDRAAVLCIGHGTEAVNLSVCRGQVFLAHKSRRLEAESVCRRRDCYKGTLGGRRQLRGGRQLAGQSFHSFVCPISSFRFRVWFLHPTTHSPPIGEVIVLSLSLPVSSLHIHDESAAGKQSGDLAIWATLSAARAAIQFQIVDPRFEICESSPWTRLCINIVLAMCGMPPLPSVLKMLGVGLVRGDQAGIHRAFHGHDLQPAVGFLRHAEKRRRYAALHAAERRLLAAAVAAGNLGANAWPAPPSASAASVSNKRIEALETRIELRVVAVPGRHAAARTLGQLRRRR